MLQSFHDVHLNVLDHCSKKADDPVDQYLNPLRLLHELDQVLDDNSILVADGGDFVGSAAYILR